MKKLFLAVVAALSLSAGAIVVDTVVNADPAEATIGGCSYSKLTSGAGSARCTSINNTPPLYSRWAWNGTCHFTWGYSNVTTGWRTVSSTVTVVTCASPGVISSSGVFVFK